MKKLKTYTYYQDPGHGWLKVDRKMLKELNIHTEITGYSYQFGEYVYLEEDCDAGLFFEAYMKKFGVKPKHRSEHTNNQSKIRSYQSYCPVLEPLIKDNAVPGMKVIIYGKEYLLIQPSGKNWIVENDQGKKFTAKISQMSIKQE